ncbi:MAG: MFS transporter [Acidimicrobiales bacterium]
MTRLAYRHRVPHDSAHQWLLPRNDVVIERTTHSDPGSAGFEAHIGPFQEWHREVSLTVDSDGHTIVDEIVNYRLAVPVWGVLFRPALRRHLRRAPKPEGHQPWWAPPEALDARAATVLSVLCLFAVVSGYLGTLITQTLTYAAEQFGANTAEQGRLLAIVRVGVLLSLGIIVLADKFGRRRILVAGLLGSCVVTAFGAASTGMVWLGVSQTFARSLSTVVVVVIAVMAAEEMPAGTRAFAVSVVAMTAALGAGMCVLNLVYIDIAQGAWRIAYVIPLLAIYPCIRIARRLPETKRFDSYKHRIATASETAVRNINWQRFVMLATGAFLWSLFLAPAAQFLNEFLRTERGFSGMLIAVFVLATNTPAGIGIMLGGKLADRYGRRSIGAIGIAGGVAFTCISYLSWGWPLWLASAVAATIGALAVPALAVYGPELFPTSQRGRANGGLQVVGVAGSSLGLLTVGWLADRVGGLGQAMAVVAIAPALLILVVVFWFPETAKRELEDLNPSDQITGISD